MNNLTVIELKTIAKQYRVKNYSTMLKQELIDSLKPFQQNYTKVLYLDDVILEIVDWEITTDTIEIAFIFNIKRVSISMKEDEWRALNKTIKSITMQKRKQPKSLSAAAASVSSALLPVLAYQDLPPQISNPIISKVTYKYGPIVVTKQFIYFDNDKEFYAVETQKCRDLFASVFDDFDLDWARGRDIDFI